MSFKRRIKWLLETVTKSYPDSSDTDYIVAAESTEQVESVKFVRKIILAIAIVAFLLAISTCIYRAF